MSDLKTSLNAIKDKNFGYFFDKDGKCYIYHTKFGKERNSEISGNDNIESKFRDLIDDIYKENDDKFNSLKEAFENYLYIYNDKSTIHIKFDKDGEFLQTKSEIVNKFSETFGKKIDEIDFNQGNFNDETFKQWWDKSINSARMQGNATNLLKDKGKLIENLKKIKEAAKSETLTKLFEALSKVEGMSATARELAYFLQFNLESNDKFPLANDAMINMAKYIFEMLNEDSKKKLEDIKKETTKTRNEEIYFNFVLDELKINENSYNLPKYYILDQFLNLIDKIKKSDLALITKERLAEKDNNKDPKQSVYYILYQAAYDFANLCGKADIKSNDLEGFKELLKTHKNIIFHGIPGTGKTYTIVNNIKNIIKNENQMLITQFHPSFSYEDFIEGIKPAGIENGQLKLELKNGIFREFCDKAKEEEKGFLEKLENGNFNEALSDHGYFFIADEINRAELSRVFGELLYALEYRGEKGKIKTQYASMRRDDEDFYVPENVFFLGTMNDLDKSIDSFDLALRRRFIWQEMECDYDVIRDEIYAKNIEEYAQACQKLNKKISNDIGEKYQLGHSYFLKIEFKNDEIKDSDMKKLFSNRFEALLKEYLRSEYSEKDIQKYLNELKKLFVIEKPKETKTNEKNNDKNK
ncbi:hypothetical protein CK568_01075 [Campylobacter lari]|nr:hypothetical protein [Campylobacter lari]EAL7138645.1 hypothetical protein [Campylobacter lari]